MADNRREEAIDIVARGILSDVPEEHYDSYRDDPDTISREIWDEVNDRLHELVPDVNREEFTAAYEYLSQLTETQ